MTSREAFEAIANDTIRKSTTYFLFNRNSAGHYISNLTAHAFLDWDYAFKAGRESMREEAAKVCDETWVEPGDMQVGNCHEAARLIRSIDI